MILLITFNLLIFPSANPLDSCGNFIEFKIAALSLENPRLKEFKLEFPSTWSFVSQSYKAEKFDVLSISLK